MTSPVSVNITIAEPSPLGVFGLALITFVASSQKLGFTTGSSLLIPWALFLGCGAQLIACFMDYKKNNVYGATVFGAFALFWFAMSFSWLIMGGAFGEKLALAADPRQLGFAFLGFLLFTLPVTVVTMETNKTFLAILICVDLLLIGLAGSSLGIGDKAFMDTLAAYSELATALLGFYCSAALFMNTFCGRVILPLGKPLGILMKPVQKG